MFKFGKGEKTILEVRKHWFVIFIEIILLCVVALIPLVLAYFFNRFLLQGKEINLGGEMIYLFSFAYFLWLLGIWITFFIYWTDYYLDVWHVTDKRIIAVNQKGLFRREVIDLRYEKIQDVTIEVRGIIQTLLNFGELHVQTAGSFRDVILKQAKNPTEAKKIILLQHSKILDKK